MSMASPHAPVRDRLVRYWLKRLRHQTYRQALQAAVNLKILQRVSAGEDAPVRYAPGQKSETFLKGGLRRKLRLEMIANLAFDGEEEDAVFGKKTNREIGPEDDEERGDAGQVKELLAAVREAVEPALAAEFAIILMLGDAVARSGHSLTDLYAMLSRPRPVVVLEGSVCGLERCCSHLLRRGILLPRPLTMIPVDRISLDWSAPSVMRPYSPRLTILLEASYDMSRRDVERGLQHAPTTGLPLLGIADLPNLLPKRLSQSADLTLRCEPLSPELLKEIAWYVIGAAGDLDVLDAVSPEESKMLSLDDLLWCIRPGMSGLDVLKRLQAKIAQPPEKHSTQSKKSARNAPSPHGRTADTGGELIQPAAPNDESALRVEALSGYGEAAEWALALKEDLVLWREGQLEWQDMITRLLLHGPPGTGKTTFAKALANSLQLPLLASSVSTWLEPSALGEVLQRVRQTFEEAERHNPIVLFIDEIDGLGTRGGHKDRDSSYWNSFVNKALELLDGAVAREGVIIVGATNQPHLLDRALVRSGRLETHIEIPLPDTKSLLGILRHHLKRHLTIEGAEIEQQLLHIARRANGMSGADMEKLVRGARQLARGERRDLLLDDVEARLKDRLPQLDDALRHRFAVHEAGHVVVRTLTGVAEVELVAIEAPNGRPYTQSTFHPDVTHHEEGRMNLIHSYFAGRAAEEVILGKPTLGAGGGPQSDLAQATALAFSLEASVGAGAHQPFVYRSPDTWEDALASDPELRARVSKRLDEAYAQALVLVRQNVSGITLVAEALVEHGTLEGEPLAQVIDQVRQCAMIRDEMQPTHNTVPATRNNLRSLDSGSVEADSG
ncbi:AAA family ATPase [Nitratireductor basaltis]|uniref:Putative ATP-dependent hydrolase protein n=1 Tax=Nitratireductor basaltis TaxID=472175 RepID=A0A084U9F7_9HYPH|nr:AAA family ATPase [Nitratireductor basaltis]KFB09593.1 putative ATP-dependent hydrolase protein [Nitratireductor basaltis]